MTEKFSHAIDNAVAWLVASVLGGVVYLIRRVFTNQKEIDMLKADLKAREKQREEDREQTAEIKRSVERIEGWIVDGKPTVQHWNDKTNPPR